MIVAHGILHRMKLGREIICFIKFKLPLVALIFGLICINAASMPISTFNYCSPQELVANNLIYCKKNNNGLTEVDLAQTWGDYFASNHYTVQKMCNYMDKTNSFFTFDMTNDYIYIADLNGGDKVEIEQGDIIGYCTNESTPQTIPLDFIEMEEFQGLFSKNYLSFLDASQDKGCFISEAYAKSLAETLNLSDLNDLIGRRVVFDSDKKELIISCIVKSSCFPLKQNINIDEMFICSNYMFIMSLNRKSTLRLFLGTNYYYNYSLLNYFFLLYKPLTKVHYFEMTIPNNQWLEEEINFIIDCQGVYKNPSNSTLLILLIVLSFVSGFAFEYCKRKKCNLKVGKEKFLFYSISFLSYLTLSPLVALIFNNKKFGNIYISTVHSMAYLFMLLYWAVFLVGICIAGLIFNRNPNDKADIVIEDASLENNYTEITI